MKRALEHALLAAARERTSIVAGTCMLAGALGLKAYYAHAGAAELRFVLAPSCWLAAHVFGVSFYYEAGQGYVAREARMIVGPACAGMNFLVVCWLALYFSRQNRYARLRDKLGCWVASLGIAYLATAIANGTRIALAAELAQAHFYTDIVTHERVHRLLGVCVYCTLLLGLCSLYAGRARYLVPLACYAAVALGVPLCRRACGVELPGLFEHATQTCAAVTAVALAAWVLARLFSGQARRARESRWLSREY